MNTHGSRRAFALLATMAAAAAAFAFLFGSGPSAPRGAQAAGAPTASVSCSDIYQDIDNDTPLGSAHDADDVPAVCARSVVAVSAVAT